MKNILRRFVSYIYSRMASADAAYKLIEIKKRYDIHPSVRTRLNTEIYGTGKISIDQDTYFGHNCMIESSSPASISIGRGCAFAYNIHIRTASYDLSAGTVAEARNMPNKCQSIVIGDYVWCGCNVFINDGVTIGDNVVIGANSVVTKSLPSNGIYAGAPARLIKSLKNE